MQIEINKKAKRFIALEFIWLLILVIVSVSILQIGNYLDNKSESELLQLTEQRRIINVKFQRKKLWHVLCENDLCSEGYEEFKKKYENTEDQIVLYNLCVNNSLYTRSLSEFRVKYFTRESALEDCYSLCTGDLRVSEDFINYQSKEDWIQIRNGIKEFKTQLKKDSIFNVAYSLFVKTGYSGSEKEFKKLLLEGDDERITDNEITNDNLPIKRYSFEAVAEKIVWLLIILLYPLRILVMMVRWSLLQIKQ
jgi:hypothetical protein